MSAQHRKPFVAFVVLALAVVVLIGAQRAEAQHGRILATGIGADVEVRGQLPVSADTPRAASLRVVAPGPAFATLADGTGLADHLLPSASGTSLTTPALEQRAAKAVAPVGQGVRHSARAAEARAQTPTSPRAGVQARIVRVEQRASTATAGGSRVSTSPGVRTPASSQASPRAQQAAAGAAAGAAVGAERDAARHRAPRGARPGRGR